MMITPKTSMVTSKVATPCRSRSGDYNSLYYQAASFDNNTKGIVIPKNNIKLGKFHTINNDE